MDAKPSNTARCHIERVSEELDVPHTTCNGLFTIDFEVEFLLYEVRDALLDTFSRSRGLAEDYTIISISHKRMSAFLQLLVEFVENYVTKKGLSGPPCGVPTLLSCTIPLTITPAFRYLCISDITLPSLIVKDSRRNRKLWFTVSKNFSKSRSTQYV